MHYELGAIFFLTCLLAFNKAEVTGNTHEIFRDDFASGNELNTSLWNAATGAFLSGFKYFQISFPENVFTRNGSLHLVARHGRHDKHISPISGRVDTRGKFDFLYGEVEWRVKVPAGIGLQPSLSLIPADCPNVQSSVCLPVVSTEYRSDGFQHRETIMTMHGNETNPRKPRLWTKEKLFQHKKDLSRDFHVYKLIWMPTSLAWHLDGIEMFRESDPRRIPDVQMQIILELIIGKMDRTPKQNPSTSQLLVDYIVVRQSGNQIRKPTSPKPEVGNNPAAVAFPRQVFRDDFNTDDLLNKSAWNIIEHTIDLVKGQIQEFESENTFVKNGSLHLRARSMKDSILYRNRPYELGRLFTKSKFNFLYGEVEWRARLPNASAAMPGIFLLNADNDNGLPYNAHSMSPMVTLLDSYHRNPMLDYVSAVLWKDNTTQEYKSVDRTINIQDLSSEFHLFKLIWLPTSLTWYIDGKEVFHVTDPKAIPSVPMQISMYLVMCHSILDSTGDPQMDSDLLIDYIVVRQQHNLT